MASLCSMKKKRPHNTFCFLCVQLPAKLINIYLLTGSSLNLIGRVGLFTRAGVRLWSTALIIITTKTLWLLSTFLSSIWTLQLSKKTTHLSC